MAENDDKILDKILNDIKDVINSNPPESEILELVDKVSEAELKSSDSSNKTKVEPEADFLKNLHFALNAQSNVETKTNVANSPSSFTGNFEQLKGGNKPIADLNAAKESIQNFKSLLKVKEMNERHSHHSDLTLESLVVDLLKPQLSQWLNENLPLIVTEIVNKEIKKLIPKDE